MGDSDNQKRYPSLGVPPVHPSEMQHPVQAQDGQQQFPMHMGPPAYGPQIITQQPTTIYVQAPPLGPDSQMMTCPSCRASIQTGVKHEPSTKTHLIAALICLCGCWCGCCLIPYCVDSCQKSVHSCPNCGTYLGSHE